MDLYLDSNDASKAKELETIVENYWSGESTIDQESALEDPHHPPGHFTSDNKMLLGLFFWAPIGIGSVVAVIYGIWDASLLIFLKELALVGGFRISWFDALLPAVIFWNFWYAQFLIALFGIYTEAKESWTATTGVKEWIRTFLGKMNYSDNFSEAMLIPFSLLLMQGISWIVITLSN